MIEALIDGERRPQVLADLAKGKMRVKIPDLTLALEGRCGDHNALICRLHLDHIDHLEAMISKLGATDKRVEISFITGRATMNSPSRLCMVDHYQRQARPDRPDGFA